MVLGDVFDLEVTRTWEFNPVFPIRSMAISYILFRIPLQCVRVIMIYIKYYTQFDLKTPYTLLVVPRLIMCCLSFLNDYSLYRICRSYGIQYETRLIALASSFVMLVFGTRTFSNTVEMVFVSILLFYVSECMIVSNTLIHQQEIIQKKFEGAKTAIDRVRFLKMKMSLPGHSFNNCFIISTLCVAGIFNRPTFFFFGFPIVFFWLHRGMGSKVVTFLDFNLRMGYFVISSFPSIILFVLIDSFYFGYLTEAEIDLREIGINNFVLTPWNFVKYNIDPSKTAAHGVHPKYLHFLVNIPMLFNILGVVSLFSMGFMVYRFIVGDYRSLPRAQSVISLMSTSIFIPTCILSLINHQEPRFLIPLTLPVILLHAPKLKLGYSTKFPFKQKNCITNFIYERILSAKSSTKYLLNLWFTVNIVMTLFFGFLHQGGIYQLDEHFYSLMRGKHKDVHVHLATSHIYSLPQSLLWIPDTKILHVNPENGQRYRKTKKFHMHEFGSLEMDKLYQQLRIIVEAGLHQYSLDGHRHDVYLAIPSSLAESLNFAFYQSNSTAIKHNLVKVYYPHLSTEAIPRFFTQHPCEVNTDFYEMNDTCNVYDELSSDPFTLSYVLRQFSSIIHQFGLILYRVEQGRVQ